MPSRSGPGNRRAPGCSDESHPLTEQLDGSVLALPEPAVLALEAHARSSDAIPLLQRPRAECRRTAQ